MPDASDGLGGLGSDAKARARSEAGDVSFRFDNVVAIEIAGEADDFHMTAPANDDGMVAFGGEFGDRPMSERNERTGAFEHFVAVAAGIGDGSRGRAMSGDHGHGSFDAGGIGLEADAATAEVVQDGFVMDQFAQDRERTLLSFGLSESDGIANAEAHTEMICFDNIHRTAS